MWAPTIRDQKPSSVSDKHKSAHIQVASTYAKMLKKQTKTGEAEPDGWTSFFGPFEHGEFWVTKTSHVFKSIERLQR